MLVKLKILSGSNAGKELKVSSSKFLIGRGEDCSLRARSDKISRHHCVMKVEASKIVIRDLDSRNGTYVNGERLKAPCELQMGDVIKVGPLEFELLVDHSLGGEKKPKVQDIKEAAARTASSDLEDGDISQWLEEGDEADREQRLHDPETRKFKVDQAAAEQAAESAQEGADNDSPDKKKKAQQKKEPGKLPPKEEDVSKDSQAAAEKMLKKFFDRH